MENEDGPRCTPRLPLTTNLDVFVRHKIYYIDMLRCTNPPFSSLFSFWRRIHLGWRPRRSPRILPPLPPSPPRPIPRPSRHVGGVKARDPDLAWPRGGIRRGGHPRIRSAAGGPQRRRRVVPKGPGS